MVLVPALLMVSTIRFRSFKTFDLQTRRSYTVLLLVALVLALFAAKPDYLFVVLAYGYLLSAFVELAWTRLRKRPATGHEEHEGVQQGQPAQPRGGLVEQILGQLGRKAP